MKMLTMMSWIPLIEYAFGQTRMFLVKEMGVLPFGRNIGSGRMDAVKIKPLKGKFSAEARKRLNDITSRQYKSFSDLVSELEKSKDLIGTFGIDFDLEVWDFKFPVGDGVTKGKVVEPEQISDHPIKKHNEQVLRYLLFASLELLLSKLNRMYSPGAKLQSDIHLWEQRFSGRLLYFLPSGSVVYDISPSEEELEDKLIEYTENLDVYFREALHRDMAIGALKQTMRVVREKSNNKRKPILFSDKSGIQLELPLEDTTTFTKFMFDVAELVKNRRNSM